MKWFVLLLSIANLILGMATQSVFSIWVSGFTAGIFLAMLIRDR